MEEPHHTFMRSYLTPRLSVSFVSNSERGGSDGR
ncbi:protein of unknown function [Aminobacter niigataensis]|nr:protein of unknown function [Aminobacter niigataensis]